MLEQFRDLPAKDLARQGYFIAEGKIVLRRLLRSSLQCRAILCGEQQAAEFRAIDGEVPIHIASKEEIGTLVGYEFHRGALGLGVIPAAPDPAALLRCWCAAPRAKLLLLPHCSDPQNLGTLIRTARALDFTGVVVGQKSSFLYSRRSVRVAMGSMFDFDVIQVDDFGGWLRQIAAAMPVWALNLSDAARPLSTMAPPAQLALMLGNEGAGFESGELSHVSDEVLIPMAPGTDSLNIAASGAIAMYAVAQE